MKADDGSGPCMHLKLVQHKSSAGFPHQCAGCTAEAAGALLQDSMPLLWERQSPPVAPGDNYDSAAGRADARELADKALLVRHVLATLQAPHQVKGGVRKRLLQRIGHLE